MTKTTSKVKFGWIFDSEKQLLTQTHHLNQKHEECLSYLSVAVEIFWYLIRAEMNFHCALCTTEINEKHA